MLNKLWQAYKLVYVVKKTSSTRFITAYTAKGRINGIMIKRGFLRSTIRVPLSGDVTVWNHYIKTVRHQRVSSKQYMKG